MNLPTSKLTKSQSKIFSKNFTEGGRDYLIEANISHDDSCGNGHNTFAITGSIYEIKNGRKIDICGGAIHDDITKHFPNLKPYIKWHLCSTDGPMHYVANTAYHASDRDHWGKLKGEPYRPKTALQFGDFPIIDQGRPESFYEFLQASKDFNFDIASISHNDKSFSPRFTFVGYGDQWHDCPFNTLDEARQYLQALQKFSPKFTQIFTAWGEGKARNFNAARQSAIWPEATDEELSVPKAELEAKLLARLPTLMQEFKAAIESLGFEY